MNNGEKRTLKGLILEMKLSENSEERIIAEETILNIFEQLEKEKAELIEALKESDELIFCLTKDHKGRGGQRLAIMQMVKNRKILSKLGGGGNG